jgi:GMP synthase (glutamine-hydrolysing)
MEQGILLIDMCRENLHSLEFVKPIEKILKSQGKKYFIKKYCDAEKKDFESCSKIIISGTSLKDNDYLKFKCKFSILTNLDKKVLGICAGAQMIGLVFGEKIVKLKEIGLHKVKFEKNFLGLTGETEIYSLHGYSFKVLKNFEVYARSENCIQAFRHKQKQLYGTIFHPEVKNKKLIIEFLK